MCIGNDDDERKGNESFRINLLMIVCLIKFRSHSPSSSQLLNFKMPYIRLCPLTWKSLYYSQASEPFPNLYPRLPYANTLRCSQFMVWNSKLHSFRNLVQLGLDKVSILKLEPMEQVSYYDFTSPHLFQYKCYAPTNSLAAAHMHMPRQHTCVHAPRIRAAAVCLPGKSRQKVILGLML